MVACGAAALGLAPATIAYYKGRDPVSWWLAGSFLFVVALPAAILVDPKPGGLWQQCPHCLDYARTKATVCRKCGRDLPPDD